MELPKKYKFKEIEAKWREFWNEQNTYAADESKPPFTIDTPPPTVSGKMHLGHAFSYSQGDFIARFQRMNGKGVFYPFGTDDNGIPTEHLIEKTKKVRSTAMSRPEFVALCNETLKEIKPEFVQAWIDLGISADFENSYSTITNECIKVSQKSFLDLYQKELVKREVTPVAWSVTSQTAIAQADFENIEKKSSFNDIAFSDEEGKELIISTTRPELLPACVALFAHPDDERYQYLKGKSAIVPLFNYKVPILFDEAVALDKGTGLMMVCTFGDKEDIEKWYKYKLELRSIFTKHGRLTELAGKYKDMKIVEAREAIVEDLKSEGLLKSQKEIVHNVNVYERDGTPIEFMVTPQWFIKVLDKKEELVNLANEITWHPSHMKVRYENWVNNLNWDWCISRQRHFGVPFPVWYEKDTGNIIVAQESDLPIDPAIATPKSYQGDPNNLIAETDVMDTWATSSVTPQIALKWGDNEKFSEQHPMSLRMQAHDIIRTWAFYTIVKSYYHHNTIPWKNIMVSGFVLDKHGKKMSKSKGNVIDPMKLVDLYGADTVRYAASTVKLGEDMPFHDKYLETGKKTVTKLFNAAKFVHMHLENYSNHDFDIDKIEPIDKWIIDAMNTTIADATNHLEAYEFAKARSAIEQFFWHQLCDDYLEIVKDRLYKPELYGEESKLAAQMTLYEVLLTVLKLFAPYLPHVTEEVYSWYFVNETGHNSIHTSVWPSFNEGLVNVEAELSGTLACAIIGAVRKFKSTEQVSQKHGVAKLSIATDDESEKALSQVLDAIKMTISAEHIEFVETATTAVQDGLSIDVVLAEKDE